MIKRTIALVTVAAASALTAACATADGAYPGEPAYASAVRVEYGVVQSVREYRASAEPQHGGAVLGAIAGGVIGHQIGSGGGNTAATLGGALAGGVIGNEVDKNRERSAVRYHVTVKLDSGATLEIESATDANVRIGDRVRVENGRIFRE